MPEPTMWGIHAGDSEEAGIRFLKEGWIALGWPETGDLRKLRANREAYKNRYVEAFPSAKSGEVPVSAGQLFRFVNEMESGDTVAFPFRPDRTVHIGRVTGPYRFEADELSHYPHRRTVDWLKSEPRSIFSQGALNELGSALSIFQIKNYAEEFRAALSGAPIAPPVDEDLSVSAVAKESRQSTEDFILKRLAQNFKSYAFEHFVANLLQAMGFRTSVTKMSGDGGIDIVAHRDALGFEPPIIKVQVKSTEGSVGEPEVKQLKGNLSGGEKGLLVTLGTFSSKAQLFARTVPDIRLIDGQELVKLILEHYENFDGAYRAAMPLKRVYLPSPPDEQSD